MEYTINERRNRAGRIIEKIEDVVFTVSGIAIGLSPILVFF